MKSKTFFDSMKYASQGFITGIKTERNFRIYIVIAVVLTALNFILKISFTEHIICFGVYTGAFSAEFLNTAIEHLANLISKDYNTEIKLAKDIAAASVMMWGLMLLGMEIAFIARFL